MSTTIVCRAPRVALLAVLALSACTPARTRVPVAPPPAIEEPEQLGERPELIEVEVRDVARELLGDVEYDLPLEANTWVAAELDFLIGQRREVIGRWLQRGDAFEDAIKQVLRDHGLPTDLYHVAMIESGFVPTARSRAGAVGIWQFMPATARGVGLRVDTLVDERIDPLRSTHAAARHLRWLIATHRGDWALAAAAYNAGSGRIGRSLERFGLDNFWDLAMYGDLADETKHYVPRLYAMTIIARDRERFGFPPRSAEPAVGFAVDSVVTDYATPLAELARLGEVPADVLARLNPHLLRRTTPPGRYALWVPAGAGAGLQQAYLDSEFRRQQGHGVYVVRRGDSLSRIAQRSGVRAAEVRALNPSVNFDVLRIGERLRLPYLAVQRLDGAAAAAAVAEPPPAARPAQASPSAAPRGAQTATHREHVVQPGETLWALARRYGVAVGELEAANGIRGGAIRAGQTLRIPGAAEGNGAAAAPRATAEHVVKSGDTLWSIAREYGASVDGIQAANRIDGSRIVPGQRLVIPLDGR